MKTILAALALALLAPTLRAQDVTMPHPTIVIPRVDLAERLAERYENTREHLWCITSWTTTTTETYDRVDILAIAEQDVVASDREIPNASAQCHDKDGKPLPMIHSHPAGAAACQASPQDLTTIVSRLTPFDGILCAPTSLVWYFAPKELAAWAAQEQASMVKP